jgi:hypothetical protein
MQLGISLAVVGTTRRTIEFMCTITTSLVPQL